MDSAPRSDSRSWRHKPGVAWLYVFIITFTVALVIPSSSRREEMIRLGCYVVESRDPSPRPNITSWPLSQAALLQDGSVISPTTSLVGVGPTGFDDIDLEACKRNVKVQKLLARISMVSETSSGVLGAMSTAAWSSLSDRIGRCKILALAVVGFALRELLFVLVLLFPQAMVYTGGSVLYVGPIIDGILGGNELLTSVYTAYMADVTSVDNISINTAGFGVASSLTAMVMPMVGPFLVASTGDRLLPFKIGLVLQILLAVFVGVIVPESLSVEAREHHVKVAAAEHAEQERLEAHDSHDSTCHQRFGRRIQRLRKQVMRHILAPLDALSVFMPKPFQDGRPGRDWNLFCIAAIVFLVTLSREEGPEIHYTIFAFGWGQGELGRRMSLLSTWRTVTVLSIIPFYRFVLKPWLARRMARRSVSAEETPLLLPPDAADDDASPEHDMTETRAKARADLGFLGTSLLVEMLGYLTMGVNAGGSVWQYAIGKAGAIAGSQGTLVIEPLLLELGPKEQAAGRLFGASAVVSTIGGTFFNSLLFNSVLWATIGSYAPALFLVAALLYLLALVFVAGIRAPKA